MEISNNNNFVEKKKRGPKIKYSSEEERKEAIKQCKRNYTKTDKGKEKINNAIKKYFKTEKGIISHTKAGLNIYQKKYELLLNKQLSLQ